MFNFLSRNFLMWWHQIRRHHKKSGWGYETFWSFPKLTNGASTNGSIQTSTGLFLKETMNSACASRSLFPSWKQESWPELNGEQSGDWWGSLDGMLCYWCSVRGNSHFCSNGEDSVMVSDTIQVLLCVFCRGTDSFASEEAKDASAAAGKDFWCVELQRPSRRNPSETQHRNKSHW